MKIIKIILMIPFVILSAISASLNLWVLCALFSKLGLLIMKDFPPFLNQLGVSLCIRNKKEGLDYLFRGMQLGSSDCAGNYNHYKGRF